VDDESEEISITLDFGFMTALFGKIFGVCGTSVYLIWVAYDLKASLYRPNLELMRVNGR
jgi:hypothetical protein